MNGKSIGSGAAPYGLAFLGIPALLAVLALLVLLALPMGSGAHAETGAAAETEAGTEANGEDAVMTDEDFAKSLIGQTYAGGFELDGWTNLGGGLVLPPIYVQHHTRDDGTVLILTAKETEAAGRGSAARFEVTDALITDKPRRGYTFSTACMRGEDYTLRFLGEASGKDAAEWWTNLRKAWEIDVETGKISSVKARGVKCTNPNW